MSAGAEFSLQRLFSTLPCGIISFADDGRVLMTNAYLRKLLHYTDGEIEGQHVERLLTIAGRIFYQTHLFPLLRLHGEAQEIFLLLRKKDGGEVGALVNGVRAERDGMIVNDCVMIEVRERRKYEDELLSARRIAESATETLERKTEDLERANELLQRQAAELEQARLAAEEASNAKSQFLATMSHELRTPLNAIGGYVQLLELGVHGALNDGQRHALTRIASGQAHLLRLINELLNLARIESGHVDYVVEDVPIAALVDAVIPMVAPQATAAGLSLTTAVPEHLEARADRDKVQQVLINLMSNAVKFTPAGGHIAVGAAVDSDANRVAVHVSDTGIGIAADQLEGIFEPFVQVSSPKPRRDQGTGLGLSISRELARGMGGDITVESAPGVGSVFTLTLPSGPLRGS